jgi:hypothetical protein
MRAQLVEVKCGLALRQAQCAVQRLSRLRAHCKLQGAFRVARARNASGYPAAPKPMMMPAATGDTYE